MRRRMKDGLTYQTCDCNAGFEEGIVLDPFMGAGTTALVARELGRRYIGIELNPAYCKLAKDRLKKSGGRKRRKK